MLATRILLIRHGQTDDNKNLVFQGQGGRGLNAEGRAECQRLAERLAGMGAKLDAIFCSDLTRARESAEIVAAPLGLSPVADEGLREVYLGSWEGLAHQEIASRFPEEWAAWQRGLDIRRGGGETYAELGDRMVAAVDRIAGGAHGGRLGIVSHGGTIKVFVARVLGVGVASLRSFQVAANTSVSVVERREDGRYRLLVWNDVSHRGDALAEALGS
ncbi:MAG: histidine phosphatase family protein [Byssovorax sp.]